MRRIWRTGLVLAGVLVLTAGSASRAVDVEKRFRLGISVGEFNNATTIESGAANQLLLTDEDDLVRTLIRDPRDDDATLGNLEVRPATSVLIHGQYGLSKIFLLEASVGYQEGSVGDVEVQAQFPHVVIDPYERVNFQIFHVRAGDVTFVPIEVSLIARLRPKATVKPFFGLGLGYTITGFDPTDEFNELSRNLDSSIGGQVHLQSGGAAGVPSAPTDAFRDLGPATASFEDAFHWHALTGLEYDFKKHWSGFIELRYILSTAAFRLEFDGKPELGVTVPNTIARLGSPAALADYGPVQILPGQGGIVDGGKLILIPTGPGNEDIVRDPDICLTEPERCSICETSPGSCSEAFVSDPDGEVDPGFYYIQGGSIKYGGPSLHLGLRYTF